MELTEVINYEGTMYQLAFINTDSAMAVSDRIDFCIKAIEMKHSGRVGPENVKGENFEGQIKKTGHYQLAGFSGEAYEGKVETNHGTRNLGVLIRGLSN